MKRKFTQYEKLYIADDAFSEEIRVRMVDVEGDEIICRFGNDGCIDILFSKDMNYTKLSGSQLIDMAKFIEKAEKKYVKLFAE